MKKFCEDPLVWKGRVKIEPWWPKNMDLMSFFVKRQHCRYKAKVLWHRLEMYPEWKLILCQGATEPEILAAEREMRLQIPEELRASFKIHNGQHQFSLCGCVYGVLLLSLTDIVKEKKKDKFFMNNDNIPITISLGHKQWYANRRGIYLRNGWDSFRKARNWFEFLETLIGEVV